MFNTDIENMIKKYIREEIKKLEENGGEISLNNVNPNILAEVLGYDDSVTDWNGTDYWFTTDKYEVAGDAEYGNATITLIPEESKDEE